MKDDAWSFENLRNQIVGIDSTFDTPFGKRIMTYCDYTASGRCLRFIEEYIMRLQQVYANTHTEDDVTGRSMTYLLHQAEKSIKRAVNAGPHGKIIGCGYGSTAAIEKLQQILGVAWPPATRRRVMETARGGLDAGGMKDLDKILRSEAPIVFVGPYEHHSNEITWREGFAEVHEIRPAPDGGIDLDHLEELLEANHGSGRPLIGSFSAASNVTGMITPVHRVAGLLHRYDAIACFDFAAGAPYVPIDMNPPGSEWDGTFLDAVFISPHKFLGGPGSNGILVFNERLYPHDLSPTVGGGGTVDYVSPAGHDFSSDIETREKAGTPGVLQTMKAALAFQLKERIGIETIERREAELLERALKVWSTHPSVEILGNPDPNRRIGIVSFSVRDPWGTRLHPKFMTSLLNDLFGVQSRAGCSCAGPYGHTLLGIDLDLSARYREAVKAGYNGLKPGWCRIGFHYSMDDEEARFIVDSVAFLAEHGYKFLSLYDFDLESGGWSYRRFHEQHEKFSIDEAVSECPDPNVALPPDIRRRMYRSYLAEAQTIAGELDGDVSGPDGTAEGLDPKYKDLLFFRLPPPVRDGTNISEGFLPISEEERTKGVDS